MKEGSVKKLSEKEEASERVQIGRFEVRDIQS
jgi:hypothetical protein